MDWHVNGQYYGFLSTNYRLVWLAVECTRHDDCIFLACNILFSLSESEYSSEKDAHEWRCTSGMHDISGFDVYSFDFGEYKIEDDGGQFVEKFILL